MEGVLTDESNDGVTGGLVSVLSIHGTTDGLEGEEEQHASSRSDEQGASTEFVAEETTTDSPDE